MGAIIASPQPSPDGRGRSVAKGEGGSILILSLWVMTLMILTAASLAYRAAIELRLSRYQWDEIRLIQETKMTARNGVGGEDESARIDLNRASKEVLLRLFLNHPEVVTSILEWRTPLPKSGILRDDPYTGLGYSGRHGPFKSVEELLLVKNMTPEIFRDMRGILTVYGSKSVNINTAKERVLDAMGLQPSLVGKIVRFRASRDDAFTTVAEVMPRLKKSALLSEAETANLSALLRQGKIKVQSDAVHLHLGRFQIVAAGRPSPGRILSWQETPR